MTERELAESAPRDGTGMIERINELESLGRIDHATWCNALRYECGDYDPLHHGLCRAAWMRCTEGFTP